MDLVELAERIEWRLINENFVVGKISVFEMSNKGMGKVFSLKYDFPQGTAREMLSYDIGDSDEDRILSRAKTILDSYFSLDVKILKLKETKDNLSIKVFYDSYKPSLDEFPLGFYLECESTGVSPEESGYPSIYEDGRTRWLEKH